MRALRYGLPLAAVALFATYFVSVRFSISTQNGGQLSLGVPTISGDKLAMADPEYSGFNKDGSRFVVRAKTAEQDPKQPGPVQLKGIEARLLQTDANLTVMKSPRGTFDTKTGLLELYDQVHIDGETGLKARLTRATVATKDGRVSSSEPVLIEMPTGAIRGNAMTLDQKTKDVAFSNGVAARLLSTNRQPAGKPVTQPSAPSAGLGSTGGSLLARSDAPVDITSERLDLNDETKIAIFRGRVKASQGEATLEAPELEVAYDGQSPGLDGAAKPQPAGQAATASQGRVKRLIARGDVIITRGVETAKSRTAEFDGDNETARLTGGVLMTSGGDRQATGDRAEIDMKTDKAKLIGNVVVSSGSDQRATADVAEMDQKNETALLTGREVLVSQGRNTLRGRRLFVDRKAASTEMSNPGGRIAARFWRPEQQGPGKSDAKPASPSSDAGGFTLRTDPTAPIDVDADTLSSNDNAKTATFRGTVKAVQGTFKIETPELVATYAGDVGVAGESGIAGAKKAANKGDKKDGAGTELQRIRANKGVKVTSVNDQEVTGDWADFDVKANTVTIGGKVLITQGTSRLYATKVVVDMTTGKTSMETTVPTGATTIVPTLPEAGKPTAEAAQARAAAIAAGNCNGRPCLMVFPQQVKERAKQKAQELAPGVDLDTKSKQVEQQIRRAIPRSSSSWEATTDSRTTKQAN